MKIIVLHNQTLLDLAIQYTGTAENAFDLALANNKSITDDLQAGESIDISTYDTQKNKDILNYYQAKKLQPATGLSSQQLINDKPEGIDYWAIQTDFIVS